MARPCKPAIPFRYFYSSPEVIRLVVMMYVRFPLDRINEAFACGESKEQTGAVFIAIEM